MKPDWTVMTGDGVILGAKVTEPIGRCRGDVLLLHAMMVDARCLDKPPGKGFASELAARGYRVHRADFRGRGMSERPTDWTYDDLVYEDIPALVGALGDRPLVVGHSLGGHITAASWAAGQIELAGLVCVASACWMPSLERSRRMRLKKGLLIGVLRGALRAFGRVPSRRAGMGPVDEAYGYGCDLARFWKTDRWADRTGRDWVAGMRKVQGPVLQVVSAGDAMLGHADGASAWVQNFPAAEVWRLEDGSLGIEKAPDHMALGINPLSRPMWAAIARWMHNHA